MIENTMKTMGLHETLEKLIDDIEQKKNSESMKITICNEYAHQRNAIQKIHCDDCRYGQRGAFVSRYHSLDNPVRVMRIIASTIAVAFSSPTS